MKAPPFVLAICLVALAACSGSSSSAPDETAPPPSPAPTSSARSTEQTNEIESTSLPTTTEFTEPTTSTTTEQPSTTTSDTPPNSEPALPGDLGPRLDSVTGVNTPGEIVELIDMVALFVPSESDPDDANVAVPLPEDIEIITAYARAMQALYGQVTKDPIPVEPSAEMRSTFLDGGQKYSQNVFTPRNEADQHLAFFGENDVLRPVVLADPRSEEEAFIFDCAISGSRYANADGSLADGETPGSELAPLIVRLVKVEGSWIVDDIQDDERACR